MKKPQVVAVRASNIAAFLNTRLYGKDVSIVGARSIDDVKENTLVFSKGKVEGGQIERAREACFITSELPDQIGSNAFILVKNPRLAFAKTLSEFFIERETPGIGQNSVIDPTANIASTAIVGSGCAVGRNVQIGEYTQIRHNVVIADGVKIGRYCLIRSHSVIGEEGFGFEWDEDGVPLRIPHLGSVEIGDYTEIGNFVAVARGTLGNTVICSHAKIDNLVHIAHNCIIGERTMIIACSEVSGSTIVGDNCWLGAGCSTIQKIAIGENSTIGIGAVVLNDVPADTVVAGNPARVIRKKMSQ